MIYVTRLDGSQLVVNADLIETIEHTADTVISLLDGKKLVVATPVHEVVDRVLAYRQLIARGPLRMVETPPLGSAAAAVHGAHEAALAAAPRVAHEPTPIRPRESN